MTAKARNTESAKKLTQHPWELTVNEPFAACPVDSALRLLSGKWKPRILYRLSLGTQRFGELKRSIPGVTQRILTLQLRELEQNGMIKRKVYAEVPPKVEYSLTEAAVEIGPILKEFGAWFDRHAGELRDGNHA